MHEVVGWMKGNLGGLKEEDERLVCLERSCELENICKQQLLG